MIRKQNVVKIHKRFYVDNEELLLRNRNILDVDTNALQSHSFIWQIFTCIFYVVDSCLSTEVMKSKGHGCHLRVTCHLSGKCTRDRLVWEQGGCHDGKNLVCGPRPRKRDHFNSGRLRSFLRGGRFVRNWKRVSFFAGKESEERLRWSESCVRGFVAVVIIVTTTIAANIFWVYTVLQAWS